MRAGVAFCPGDTAPGVKSGLVNIRHLFPKMRYHWLRFGSPYSNCIARRTVTTPLWIGFGFLVLLVLFLIVSFWFKPKLTDDQRATLKFLTALCAGFSGGFLTGGALFNMQRTAGATTFGVSGTAGCALFFVVWFFYPKIFKLQDGFQFAIPDKWTFRDAVDTMVQAKQSFSDFRGFTPQELDAALKSRSLSSKSLTEALTQLRLITVASNAIRPYDVALDGSVYRLTVRGR